MHITHGVFMHAMLKIKVWAHRCSTQTSTELHPQPKVDCKIISSVAIEILLGFYRTCSEPVYHCRENWPLLTWNVSPVSTGHLSVPHMVFHFSQLHYIVFTTLALSVFCYILIYNTIFDLFIAMYFKKNKTILSAIAVLISEPMYLNCLL